MGSAFISVRDNLAQNKSGDSIFWLSNGMGFEEIKAKGGVLCQILLFPAILI